MKIFKADDLYFKSGLLKIIFRYISLSTNGAIGTYFDNLDIKKNTCKTDVQPTV